MSNFTVVWVLIGLLVTYLSLLFNPQIRGFFTRHLPEGGLKAGYQAGTEMIGNRPAKGPPIWLALALLLGAFTWPLTVFELVALSAVCVVCKCRKSGL